MSNNASPGCSPSIERVGVAPAPDAGQRITQRLLTESLEEPQLFEPAPELRRHQPNQLIGEGVGGHPVGDGDRDSTRRADERDHETVAIAACVPRFQRRYRELELR